MERVDYQPERTASLGLIYRLNALWEKVDRRAESGNYDNWELILDRIFCNLLYRNEIEIVEDDNGNIIDIKLSEKDKKIWEKIKEKIRKAKQETFSSLRNKDILLYKFFQLEHYNSLLFYDIWLRKFMQKLGGMYIRETDNNPSKALFGGAFSKKFQIMK